MTRQYLPLLFLSAWTFASAQNEVKPQHERTEVQKPAPAAGAPAVDPSAQQPAKPEAPKSNAWFPVLEKDLGTVYQSGEATSRFPFQNPNNEAVQFRAFGASCSCSRAVIHIGDRRYEYSNKPKPNSLIRVTEDASGRKEEEVKEIEVAPHESGEVEVHMAMNGYAGKKTASLDIHCTDKALPYMKLEWHAKGERLFKFDPEFISMNLMSKTEVREFEFSITSQFEKDFNILKLDELGPEFKISSAKEMKDGVAVWKIRGTFGPAQHDYGGGGYLKVTTDVKSEPAFLYRIDARVTGPVEVKPANFVPLGVVKLGTGKTEKVTFEPMDGGALQVTSVKFEEVTIDAKFFTSHQSVDGKKAVVELEVSKDAPAGQFKGTMVVGLSHPTVKEKRIGFSGFVR
jgi:hypothetical protein